MRGTQLKPCTAFIISRLNNKWHLYRNSSTYELYKLSSFGWICGATQSYNHSLFSQMTEKQADWQTVRQASIASTKRKTKKHSHTTATDLATTKPASQHATCFIHTCSPSATYKYTNMRKKNKHTKQKRGLKKLKRRPPKCGIKRKDRISLEFSE